MKYSLSFRFFVLLFLLISFLTVDNSANSTKITIQQTDPDPIDLVIPPQFKINSTIPINVVFIGFDESNIDVNQIDNGITHWYSPIISQGNHPYLGTNYTLEMNYYFSNSTTLENDYLNFLSTVVSAAVPTPDSIINYDSGASGALLFPAAESMTWLDNNINNYFPSTNDSYTIYLIDTYTWGYIVDYYLYTIGFIDPDTGVLTDNKYTILFGGQYPNRGVFLDLSAGPMEYYATDITEANEGVSSTTIKPIWEYSFPADKIIFNSNITEYIQETIDLVFTPSYIYDPEIKENFEIEIFLFDDATSSVVSQIDTNRILNSFGFLFPTLNVTTSLTVDSVSNYPDLVDVINNNIDINIIDFRPVVDYLSNHLTDFGMNENSIPIFIWTWDNDLWFIGENFLGFAADDGFGNPSMVLMGYNPALFSDQGYTATIIHETGHMIGLRHPHDGFSFDKLNDTGNHFVSDWLRDFISTPMTYAFNDVTFSTFDVDNIYRAYAYERINDTWWNLANANYTLLVDKGYYDFGQTGISDNTDLQTYLDWTLANKTLSLNNFENEWFFDAFYYANLSSYASELYYNEVLTINDYVTPTTTTTTTTTTSDTSDTIDTSSTTPSDTDSKSNGDSSPIPSLMILSGIIVLAIRRKRT